MKAMEVTTENLEDLLAYDDVLLDYFNTFLALPVFSQPLYYNRLTGIFDVLSDGGDESYSEEPTSGQLKPLYGVTDEERERMMDWAKKERLPVFFRSYLFREYKLCCLLLRPLADHASAGHRSGMGLRGYSRQTAESCLSSLSRGPNSAKEVDLCERTAWREARDGDEFALYKYKRPRSGAFSLPVYAGLTNYRKKSSSATCRNVSSKQNSDNKRSVVQPLSKGEASEQVNNGPLSEDLKGTSSNPACCLKGETGTSRTQNSNESSEEVANSSGEEVPSQQAYTEMICEENNAVHDEYIADDFVLDEQTEEGIRDLEDRHKMSLQEMKELMLGSVQNLENFQNFLQNTSGKYLFEFWMDCEFYKDSLEDIDSEENVLIRSRLFRDIQNKYKLTLHTDAIQQLVSTAGQFGLSRSIFNQSQYDALRRLRAYWIPRYLIHKERVGELQVAGNSEDVNGQFGLRGITRSRRSSGQSGLFPSVCLVSSQPIIPDDTLDHSKSAADWHTISRSISHAASHRQSQSGHWSEKSLEKILKEKFLLALEMEKKAGSPFHFYLQRFEEKQLLCNLLFWEDVQDFSCTDSLSDDRHLRLVHGWDIFNKYLAADSEFSIGLTEGERDRIHNILLPTKNFISVHAFSSIQDQSADRLQDTWINYLKQDLKTFLDCQTKYQTELLHRTDDIEVTLDDTGQWLLVRLKPPTPLSQGSELTTEEERMEKLRNRQMCLERRRIMEKERRKVVNAAQKRQREMKNALSQGVGGIKDDDEQSASAADLASTVDKPTFKSCQNNKRIMSAFKRHLAENPDLVNAVSLFEDTELYLSLGDGLINRPKKEIQATHISKSYLQPFSKKKVPLNPVILAKLRNEKDRPKTPTLKDINNYLLPIVESSFNHFVSLHVQQMSAEGQTASGTRPMHSGGKSYENTNGSNKSAKASALTKDAIEAALMQSILTRPGNTFPQSTPAKNSFGLPFIAQKFASPHHFALSQGDGMAAAGALKQKRQKPYNGKLPPLHSLMNSSYPAGEWMAGMTSLDWYSGASQVGEHAEPVAGQNQKQGKKQTIAARINPTKDDRAQFLLALTEAAAGHLPTHMWLYYEYLVQHGEEEGNTRLDRDLFFYCEVFKFKEASHTFADEELLKRKVQSISDCYLDLVSQLKESAAKESAAKESTTAQIDVSNEILQKTLKAAQKYVAGKDINSAIFDDAQNSVFKELLPYWVGFMRNYTPQLEDRPIPLTKQMKERRKKLEEILSWKPPTASNIVLPNLPEGAVVASFTFTLNDGLRWKEGRGTDEGSVVGHQSDLGEVDGVIVPPSNISNRKTSIMSHSTIGDFKTSTHATIIST